MARKFRAGDEALKDGRRKVIVLREVGRGSYEVRLSSDYRVDDDGLQVKANDLIVSADRLKALGDSNA